ncbi:MAG: tRNA 2-thiouridine(34) synthase MnmA, partial [Proteobacteria bacterium]|nr:tRNA 2-thiouridine(34) synthase MnmA [Pseudomonadota bacterium]
MNALGFEKDPKDTLVVVAMSGGVDSSVAAALLHEQGYQVIGITLQLYDHGEALKKKGACCAGADIHDAKRVAESMGFEHYVLNYQNRFQNRVIEDFVDSYLRGETPIPCVRCNQNVKFKDLLDTARDLDADCMVTGHYVQRIMGPMGPELHKAIDAGKDQSYFLFTTTPEQLDFLRFPLGGWSKDITRQHAERLGLVVAEKPDSMDICFVPGSSYAKVVEKFRPGALNAGEIIHIDGRVLGPHNGIINYTIGQRRGIGIGGGHTEGNSPLFVVGLHADKNQVIVGPYEALARDTVYMKECNWLVEIPEDGLAVEVKLRSAQPPLPATLFKDRVILKQAAFGIAGGQACVCYIGCRVIGGGWITAAENSGI